MDADLSNVYAMGGDVVCAELENPVVDQLRSEILWLRQQLIAAKQDRKEVIAAAAED